MDVNAWLTLGGLILGVVGAMGGLWALINKKNESLAERIRTLEVANEVARAERNAAARERAQIRDGWKEEIAGLRSQMDRFDLKLERHMDGESEKLLHALHDFFRHRPQA